MELSLTWCSDTTSLTSAISKGYIENGRKLVHLILEKKNFSDFTDTNRRRNMSTGEYSIMVFRKRIELFRGPSDEKQFETMELGYSFLSPIIRKQ